MYVEIKLVEILFSLVSTAIITGIIWIGKQLKRIVSEQGAAKEGSKALLKDRIIQAHGYYMERESWPLHAMESVLDLYKQYKALGGNGAIERVIEELRRLPIKE